MYTSSAPSLFSNFLLSIISTKNYINNNHTCRVYTSSSALSLSSIFLFINSKKNYINNYYLKNRNYLYMQDVYIITLLKFLLSINSKKIDTNYFKILQLHAGLPTSYKCLFGPPHECTFHLDETRWDDIPQVKEEDNRILVEEFTTEEVKKSIFQLEHNKV
jgi:hypothetical protein